MKVQSFQFNAARYAAIVGRRNGVSVVFQGREAATDGKTIVLPQLPQGTMMSPWEAEVFGGYIDHEVCHCRHTDFEVWGSQNGEQLLKFISNLLEDIRVENKQIEAYPGTRRYMDALSIFVDKIDGRAPPSNPEAEALSMIYQEAWQKYRHVEGAPKSELSKVYPEIAALMEELPACDSTKDAMKLAVRIRELLPKNNDGMKPPDAGPLAMLDAGDLEAEATKENLDGKRVQALTKLLVKIEEINNQLINADKEGKPITSSYRMEGTTVLPPSPTARDVWNYKPAPNEICYKVTRDQVSSETNALKKMLHIYLQSRNKKGHYRGLDEGSLDEEQLYGFKFESRLYSQRRVAVAMNTAVLLLIDQSSSMDAGSTIQSTMMIAEALSSVKKIKLKISGFSAAGGMIFGTQAGYGRQNSMTYTTFKAFDEAYDRVKARLGSLTTSGYTPLGCAYGRALGELVHRTEERRVLWLLSDGEPAFQKADPAHSDRIMLERLYRKARAMHIEVKAVYVGTRYVGFLDQCADSVTIVKSTKELPVELLASMRKMMT